MSTLFTDAIADEIIERMVGGKTVAHICRFDADGNPRCRGEFPTRWAIKKWVNPKSPNHIPEFMARYAEARIEQQELWLEEVIDISDEPDIGEEITEEEVQKITGELGELGASQRTIRKVMKDRLGHRQLRIDTRLKAIAKMNPELWGDRINHGVSTDLAALITESMKPHDD